MTRIRFYGLVIEFSQERPKTAQVMLRDDFCLCAAEKRARYHVGIVKSVALAGAALFFIVWAIWSSWILMFAAYAIAIKLVIVIEEVLDDYAAMRAFGQLSESLEIEGVWYV